MLKPIKVITGKNCWDTKIYSGDEDITEKIGGIFGMDIVLRVDKLPQITIHRYGTEMKYISETPHNLTIINYDAKKAEGTEVILEDTNYTNAKNGRHYINKGDLKSGK